MAKRSFRSKSRKSNRKAKASRKNRNRNQRGGMAEWSSTGDYRLLGPADAVHAQVGSLDAAFGELPSVIPQRGGSRSRRNRSRKNKRALSRKRNHSRRQRRNQKGGMAPFGDTGRTLSASQYAADGTNPQFRTEVDVNERYTGF